LLSILIPVYNRDVTELISQLHDQSVEVNETVEIIVLDDCSDERYQVKNRIVGSNSIVIYQELPTNVGRSKIRNRLATLASHDNLLFVDCDCVPYKENYLQQYIDVLSQENVSVICGGIRYEDSIPASDFRLHWNYGSNREAISAAKRNLNAHWYVSGANLTVRKSIWQQVSMDESIANYGYEDIAWGQQASKLTTIKHIDNPVTHLGLKTDDDFLKDIQSSIVNLIELYVTDAIEETRLLKTYKSLKSLGLINLFLGMMERNKAIIVKLLKKSPTRLYMLDVLKLYYLAKKVKNKGSWYKG